MSFCFKITILAELCIKFFILIEKWQNRSTLGAPLPDHLASGPRQPASKLRNRSYATAVHCTLTFII